MEEAGLMGESASPMSLSPLVPQCVILIPGQEKIWHGVWRGRRRARHLRHLPHPTPHILQAELGMPFIFEIFAFFNA